MTEDEFEKEGEISTTVIGMKTKDGVVICADRQVSGPTIYQTDKLKKIHPNAVLGTAGVVTDIQTLVRDIRTDVTEYRMRRGRDMRVEALLESVRNRINPGSGMVLPSYMSKVILVGFDDDPMLGQIDHLGTKTEDQDFVIIGSGAEVARGVVSSKHSIDMDVSQVKDLGIESLRIAADESVHTGLGIDVATVTSDGIEFETGISADRE